MCADRGKNSAKKSPYHKDTGLPDLLLPRCAHGITSDLRETEGFPVGEISLGRATFRRLRAFNAAQCLRGRPAVSGSGRARALLVISPRKSPRGAVPVVSRPRTGSFFHACGLTCVLAGMAKLPADNSACDGIAAPSVEITMPHASSDIGFTMNTPLRTDIGPLASFISYASARKGAVNIGKELFPGS
jgi:hypothetical protein